MRFLLFLALLFLRTPGAEFGGAAKKYEGDATNQTSDDESKRERQDRAMKRVFIDLGMVSIGIAIIAILIFIGMPWLQTAAAVAACLVILFVIY